MDRISFFHRLRFVVRTLVLLFVIAFVGWNIYLRIPPESASWLSETGSRGLGIQSSRKLQVDRAGSTPKSLKHLEGETQSFSTDEPLVLLRLRAPEDLTNDNGTLCDGIMIWFEKVQSQR